MKFFFKSLALPLALALSFGRPARAQLFLPAVISAPIAEDISRGQIVHQSISATLLSLGKGLAGDMKVVSGQIKGVVDVTQQLHDQWYSSLLQISAGVRTYRRVQEIYALQTAMIGQYSAMLPELQRKGFTPVQLTKAAGTYKNLLQENVGLLSELVGVVSAGRAKMTDPERLEFINNIADRVQGQYSLMNYYSAKCRAIAQQQAQAEHDRLSLRALTGGN